MCNPSIFKTLKNHIQNPRHIHNTVKHLLWNILLNKTLCNPDIFRTLVYSQLWYILKSKHIQSPAEYLKWSILEPCVNIAYLNAQYIQAFAYSEAQCVRYSLMYQLFFKTTNLLLLLYPLLFIKSMTYSLTIYFFSHSLVYELQSS